MAVDLSHTETSHCERLLRPKQLCDKGSKVRDGTNQARGLGSAILPEGKAQGHCRGEYWTWGRDQVTKPPDNSAIPRVQWVDLIWGKVPSYGSCGFFALSAILRHCMHSIQPTHSPSWKQDPRETPWQNECRHGTGSQEAPSSCF